MKKQFKYFSDLEIFRPKECPVRNWSEIASYKKRYPDLVKVDVVKNLKKTLEVLDHIRDSFKLPMYITSSWRPDRKNRGSAHIVGKAIDFVLHRDNRFRGSLENCEFKYDNFKIRFNMDYLNMYLYLKNNLSRLYNFRVIFEFSPNAMWIHLDTGFKLDSPHKFLIAVEKNKRFEYILFKDSYFRNLK